MNDFAYSSLEALRNKLLDLSSRNALLNYRHPRKGCIRIVDELPDQIFEVLDNGKEFAVTPVPEPRERELREAGYFDPDRPGGPLRLGEQPDADEWAAKIGLHTNYSLPHGGAETEDEKHSDKNLQTLFYAPALEARLRYIRNRANSAVEETGANILYLTLGFLEWFESPSSDRPRLAPLFTVPVELRRGRSKMRDGSYRYFVSMKDDGLLTNITLREKLANDFDLDLIDVTDVASPEEYFRVVTATILDKKPRWRLRRFGTLAMLNFAKQTMYADLNPASWPHDKGIEDHPLIQQFFGGASPEKAGTSAVYADERSIDDTPNQHDHYPIICEADSSQHSALMDIVDGQSIVIEGPPGAGKSQTITNVIAACLANQKSILFVAEKMAALEVVKARLDKLRLGDFCLELHSHRTNKQQLLSELNTRMNKRYGRPADIDALIARFESNRDRLANYVQRVNSEWKASGYTPHEVFTGATRFAATVDKNPESFPLAPSVGDKLDQATVQRLIDDTDAFASAYNEVIKQCPEPELRSHHWYGMRRKGIAEYEARPLMEALDGWTESLQQLQQRWESIAQKLPLATDRSPSFSALGRYCRLRGPLQALRHDDPLEILPILAKDHAAFSESINRYEELSKSIAAVCNVVRSEAIFSEQTLAQLTEALRRLRMLGASSGRPLRELAADRKATLATIQQCRQLEGLFDRMRAALPTEIGGHLSVTGDGLNDLRRIAELINSLPAELWAHRHPGFDNPDIDLAIEKLRSNIKTLVELRAVLGADFSPDTLPSADELSRAATTITEGGFFARFTSRGRSARQTFSAAYGGRRVAGRKLKKIAPHIVNYGRTHESTLELCKSQPALDPLYDGANTRVDAVAELRNWYRAVRDEFGSNFDIHAGVGNELLALDRDQAVAIANVASEKFVSQLDAISHTVAALYERYPKVVELRSPQNPLIGEGGSLSKLHILISGVLDTVEGVLKDPDACPDDLEKAAVVTRDLQRRRQEWLSSDGAEKLVQAADISLTPEEDWEEICALLRRLLSITEPEHDENPFLQALLADPRHECLARVNEQVDALSEAVDSSASRQGEFGKLGEIDFSQWRQGPDDTISNLVERNQRAVDNKAWISSWSDYLRMRDRLEQNGLGSILTGIETGDAKAEQLSDLLRMSIFHTLSREILREDPLLAEASGLEQTAIIEKFRECDRELQNLQRKRIAALAGRSRPPAGNATGRVSEYTGAALIRHEAGKKRRHIAIRSLMYRAGDAVQALKPCFMMSPMSVAQYLAPGQFEFDVLVMDEASQIRPEDAVGAIARAKQLVVVGDPKQLPPTSFFSQVLDAEPDEDTTGLEETESILEAVMPMFKTRRLRWHYRSRHESLIAFSNQSFYDSDLVIFPSPFAESREFGLTLKRVQKGRFKTGRNVEEAIAIADFASRHLREHPDESIGIVAMNIKQRDEIEQQIEVRLKDDYALQRAYDENQSADEPMFIKNLENVQGDERDVIVISMTYGPEQVGGRVMQRFGPINSDVGWRRLNVLFTRSKKRMIIFSSMGSADILVRGKSSRGVQALRSFLEYCERGHLHGPEHTGKAADSDFEIAVINALAKHGYECEPQLGVAGYYLDLAVRDPGNPGRFILGIECDGATYHSAKSTRDRDRLRQEVLERLGWTVRRIWSTDWFKNPEAQLAAILRELGERRTVGSEEQVEELESRELAEAPQLDGEALDGIDLRGRLEALDSEIRVKFPSTAPDRRLLRPDLMQILISNQPCNKLEFFQQVPHYIRENTEIGEAKEYLDKVLAIIADYG